jgi:type IV pilus assembly protein PilM
MAKSGAVWGIDIGNCAVKALRCRRHEKDDNRIVVEAFDFIEYPKILTQPEADREELIREALQTFVSRNDLKGDRVAIAVPGQSGLSRFVKLPPVEAKKIPDMVRYEARQQIPFALEDVVWDYQALAGGNQEEGYALETEVGLFAMKRDQVHRAIRPLTEAGIEVDFIQLAPLAIYNFACFDRMNNMEGAEPFNPAKPPKSIMVLSFGTETTDLVVTNGYRVWQRNIPIGGSHFTRALTKELRLTFTKAEHVKRNAAKAEDKKAIFQAMRPVFSDLVSEIQRSMGFFMNNNKNAEISQIIGLGNPMKLPGLQRYLAQNLDQEVIVEKEFTGLIGGSVTAAPQFQANHLSFGEAYGLCVQGLGLAQLKTNLLPEEIVTERLVKGKKPWTVAAAAVMLLALMASYFGYYSSWASANVKDPTMAAALQNAETEVNKASTHATENEALKTRYDEIAQIRKNLRSNDDGRLLWLELLQAIDTALPKDPRPLAERQITVEDIRNRTELHIKSIDCEYFPDVSVWYTSMKSALDEAAAIEKGETPKKPAGDAAAPAAAGDDADAGPVDQPPAAEEAAEPGTDETTTDEAADDEPVDDGVTISTADLNPDELEGNAENAADFAEGEGSEAAGPTGAGWIIEITGYHFHNSDPKNTDDPLRENEGPRFIRNTLVKTLQEGSVRLPSSTGEIVDVPMKDLGIAYPVIAPPLGLIKDVRFDPNAATPDEAQQKWSQYISDAQSGPGALGGARPGAKPVEKPEQLELRYYEFRVQFIWQPRPREIRENPQLESEGTGETVDWRDGSWQLHQIAVRLVPSSPLQ